MKSLQLLILALCLGAPLRAEEAPTAEAGLAQPEAAAPAPETAAPAGPAKKSAAGAKKEAAMPEVDFENEDTFVDLADALKSKQYVRRAILSTVIRTTSKFTSDRWYINHLIGFNTVWNRSDGSRRYYTPLMGAALGYVTASNNGFELGLELSSPSALYAGYRHFVHIDKLSLWPFFGGGAGMAMKALQLNEPSTNVLPYTGPSQFAFFNAGLMVPLVEVGLKLEFRANVYGLSRLIFTSGVGAIFFL